MERDSETKPASAAGVVFRRMTRSMTRKSGERPTDYGLPKRKAMDLSPPPSPPRKKQRSNSGSHQTHSSMFPKRLKFTKKIGRGVKLRGTVAATVPRVLLPERLLCVVCEKDLPVICFDLASPCLNPHTPEVCRTCLGEGLRLALNSGLVRQICCPTCQSEWDSLYLCKFFSDQDMKIYRELAVDHPKYASCLQPGCKHGQIHPPALQKPQVACEKCGFEYCFGHSVPWHSGMSCAQYYDHIMETFKDEEQQNKGKEIEQNRPETPAEPDAPIKSEIPCPGCGNHDLVHAGDISVLNCTQCTRISCAECLVSMKTINEHGLHLHEKSCRFWTHPGWDDTGDVRRGVERITLELEDHRKRLQLAQQKMMMQSSSAGGSYHPVPAPQQLSLTPFQGQVPSHLTTPSSSSQVHDIPSPLAYLQHLHSQGLDASNLTGSSPWFDGAGQSPTFSHAAPVYSQHTQQLTHPAVPYVGPPPHPIFNLPGYPHNGNSAVYGSSGQPTQQAIYPAAGYAVQPPPNTTGLFGSLSSPVGPLFGADPAVYGFPGHHYTSNQSNGATGSYPFGSKISKPTPGKFATHKQPPTPPKPSSVQQYPTGGPSKGAEQNKTAYPLKTPQHAATWGGSIGSILPLSEVPPKEFKKWDPVTGWEPSGKFLTDDELALDPQQEAELAGDLGIDPFE